MTAGLLVPAAILGPAAAAALWLATSPVPWLRRLLGGVAGTAALAAGWGVFWLAFRGEPLAWHGLSPTLLGASLCAVAATAVVPVLPRAENLPPRQAVPAMVGLGAGLSAVVYASFTDSLVALALLVPLPTLAAAGAAWSARRRPDPRGLIGLAAADVLCLLGLGWVLADSGSTLLRSPGKGPAVALLLAGAAAKAGAIPWIATWRLAAAEGPAAPVAVILRAQGVVLAMASGVLIAEASAVVPQAWVAGGLMLASGAAALWGRSPAAVAAAAAGVGAGALFLALGLGGAVAVRAALLLFPPFLLAAGATAGLVERRPRSEEPRAVWRWVGAAALAAAIASLLGVPPFGGFPGTWLALSLAWIRDGLTALVGVAALGVGLGAIAGVGAVRGVRPRPGSVVAAVAVAAGLVYVGAQPIRLGIGWLIRVERELAIPELLPSAGAPMLPLVGGWDLLVAWLPGLGVVAALLVAGRGLRDDPRPFRPLLTPPELPAPVRRGLDPARSPVGIRRRLAVSLGAAAALEVAALVLAGWVLIRGMALGFL